MHVAKCEGCEKEVEFKTYKHDWPKGWTQTGRSQWGKKYHRQGGYGWWCPECDYDKHDPTNAIDLVILQGYSYPNLSLTDVIAHEARQGRAVRVAIRHAGGWAMTDKSPACTCKIYIGDDENCPVHGQKGQAK